jgi:hypothetical protein
MVDSDGATMTNTDEILNSGLVDKAADILHKLAGPMAEEFGAMLGDKVRVYRVKNLVATMQKTERILRDVGLPPNAVPPRLLLPIIENSSVEVNETLQEMWAGLLATASQQTDSVSPSFVETLKQLTPDEARHLEKVVSKTLDLHRKPRLTSETYITPYAFTKSWEAPPGVSSDTFERLGLIRRDYDVNLDWKKADSIEEALDSVTTKIGYTFVFTKYAVRFLEACHGPRLRSAENDSPNPGDGR